VSSRTENLMSLSHGIVGSSRSRTENEMSRFLFRCHTLRSCLHPWWVGNALHV